MAVLHRFYCTVFVLICLQHGSMSALKTLSTNPLYSGNMYTGTLSCNEDPDEMVAKIKKILETEISRNSNF